MTTLSCPTHCFGITGRGPEKDSVAIQKLAEGVAYRIPSLPDLDGLHHARVTELTHAEFSVEQLTQRRGLVYLQQTV